MPSNSDVTKKRYRLQEEKPRDWEDVPFLPEVSAPFVLSRPPRKIRSLIFVQNQRKVTAQGSLHFRKRGNLLTHPAIYGSSDPEGIPPSSENSKKTDFEILRSGE
ncbi:hypothetical protein TNCV_64251 [Trichonephila clavipes]|nr:hypothetical protein TNCV_64251 [Trichonephila clavipes]